MTIKKEYIKAVGGENNFLKCELYYDLGGMNYFTYKNEPRGYYVSVTPVERKAGDGYVSESTVAFSGIKYNVLQVNRKSKKAAASALEMYEGIKQAIIDKHFAGMVAEEV